MALSVQVGALKNEGHGASMGQKGDLVRRTEAAVLASTRCSRPTGSLGYGMLVLF
jgi:hypothetical protein